MGLEQVIHSPLGAQLAAFGGALLISHVALGLIVFALARLTHAAFPGGNLGRRRLLITGWFIVATGLIFTANTTWHPASIFSVNEPWWRGQTLGLYPVQTAAAAVALILVWIVLLALRRSPLRRRSTEFSASAAILLMSAAAAPILEPLRAARSDATAAPHIVIIGIDSLRNDLAAPRLAKPAIPHVQDFLSGARRFSDATSPLARTFGAWVSILTGLHPVATNARVNLMPRRLVRADETLPDALRAHGYRAIYATDESRFANIDESYGFDQLITPPTGAADFLLGYAGDMPLVNLVASTAAGRWLFPSSHANRAASVVYRPAAFVKRLPDYQ